MNNYEVSIQAEPTNNIRYMTANYPDGSTHTVSFTDGNEEEFKAAIDEMNTIAITRGC